MGTHFGSADNCDVRALLKCGLGFSAWEATIQSEKGRAMCWFEHNLSSKILQTLKLQCLKIVKEWKGNPIVVFSRSLGHCECAPRKQFPGETR